jgi:hypothetical protein
MALSQSRKVNINEYIDNMESAEGDGRSDPKPLQSFPGRISE